MAKNNDDSIPIKFGDYTLDKPIASEQASGNF
jgi:hypothetical protein